MQFLFYRWRLLHFWGGGERTACLKFRVKIQCKLLVIMWEGGREGGKVGCETGLIRRGFKSDSNAGALVAVSGVSGRGLAEWSQEACAQRGSRRRKQLLRQRQPRSAEDINCMSLK